jgi:hypothetical protein
VADIFSDASETGYGASIQLKDGTERWLFGWWQRRHGGKQEVNCMRELQAVILAIKISLRRGWIREGCDVMIHSDNTNVVFNLRKKKAGWRMRKRVKKFMDWLKHKRIRIDCEHIPGEENVKADSLSRLIKSGDYSLRRGVLAEAERRLEVQANVDLFAYSMNKQKPLYCTPKRDRNALARDAMSLRNWSELGVCLVHPPIPMIVRSLEKIRQDRAMAIVIAPNWPGQIWSKNLRQLTVRGPVVLGRCDEVLQMGRTMLQRDYALPPGDLAAWFVRG